MKDVKFVVIAEDVGDLHFSEIESDMVFDRLRLKYSYGANFENAIVIFPAVVAKFMQTEERIISKLTYTVTHELIHVLLRDINFNNEERAHGLTMELNDDMESNKSGDGYDFYRLIHGRREIVVNEEPQNVTEKTNAARNLSRMRLAQHHELTGL